MKVEHDTVTFSTGTTRYAHAGVIGIGNDNDVSEGYDGGLWSEHEREWTDSTLTKEELIELADYMIERWTKWRATVSASANVLKEVEPILGEMRERLGISDCDR
jgi:hypothetical protein